MQQMFPREYSIAKDSGLPKNRLAKAPKDINNNAIPASKHIINPTTLVLKDISGQQLSFETVTFSIASLIAFI